MADKEHRLAPEVTSVVPCPTCGQKYLIQGTATRDGQTMACSMCNTLFTLHIDGSKIKTSVDVSYEGAPIGPAEGPTRY